jgi:hypothetical protein
MRKLAPLLCLGFTQLAHAQADGGMYMGAALGTFDYEESGPDAISDDTSAYQLFGGYRFNDHLAVEVGFGRTGDIEGEFVEVIPGIGPITLEVDANFDVYTVRAIGFLPFEQLSLFGAAGYYSASLGGPVSVAGFGDIGEVDGHERGATAALGIQRDFGLDLRSLSIRGQYEWFDFGSEVDASGFSLGVLFRF